MSREWQSWFLLDLHRRVLSPNKSVRTITLQKCGAPRSSLQRVLWIWRDFWWNFPSSAFHRVWMADRKFHKTSRPKQKKWKTENLTQFYPWRRRWHQWCLKYPCLCGPNGSTQGWCPRSGSTWPLSSSSGEICMAKFWGGFWGRRGLTIYENCGFQTGVWQFMKTVVSKPGFSQSPSFSDFRSSLVVPVRKGPLGYTKASFPTCNSWPRGQWEHATSKSYCKSRSRGEVQL